jgi:hypothetical protein
MEESSLTSPDCRGLGKAPLNKNSEPFSLGCVTPPAGLTMTPCRLNTSFGISYSMGTWGPSLRVPT